MDSDGVRKVVRSVSHGLLSDFWIDGLGSMFYGTTRVAVLFSTGATVTPMGYGRSWEPRALAESSGSQLDYTPHSS